MRLLACTAALLPRGARYDASVPASCTADDATLMLQGAEACPADSVVGGGVITVDTGVPGPARFVTADAVFLRMVGGVQRNHITTPRRCPRRKTWIAMVRFSYGDGVSQMVPTANPCKRKKARRRR